MRTWDEHAIDIENAEEQVRIRTQLDRILAYSSFRNSRRYQAFLRYVVEEKLRDNEVLLKERLIGVAVFDQPLDYDTNANSVVRVTAGQVRRRLAEYYLNASEEDKIQIDLPLGSYVPEFRVHDIATPPAAELVVPDESLLYGTMKLRSQAFLSEPEMEKLPVPPRQRGWAFTVLVGCCALAVGIVLGVSRDSSTASEADRIWKGAFEGQDVLLCVGPLETPEELASEQTQHSYTGISFTTTRTVAIIGSAIGHSGGNAFLLPMQDTKVEDLQRSPAVLIGAFNNQWTMRLQTTLRYQFFRSKDGSLAGIVDTKNPAEKRFLIETHMADQRRRDYGIFAHFRSPTTGQPTVIVAGLAMHGTAAVRIFISSPELLKELSKSAPRGWEKGNYEIVLSSDQVNNLADSPKIVAVYFW